MDSTRCSQLWNAGCRRLCSAAVASEFDLPAGGRQIAFSDNDEGATASASMPRSEWLGYNRSFHDVHTQLSSVEPGAMVSTGLLGTISRRGTNRDMSGVQIGFRPLVSSVNAS